jgi:hypothetical protein
LVLGDVLMKAAPINIIENVLNKFEISNEVRHELMKAMYHLSWALWKTHYVKITCKKCKWEKQTYSDEIPQNCLNCKTMGDYDVKSIFPTMVDPNGWGSLDDDGLWKYRNYEFDDVWTPIG